VSDWLIVINQGRRIFQGPPTDLLGAEHLTLRPEHADNLATLAHVVSGHGLEPEIEGACVVATFVDAETRGAEIADIVRSAASAGITLIEIAAHRTQLEDSYLQLIGSSE
jgi:ABC-type multidrug transport system ATPase subunit